MSYWSALFPEESKSPIGHIWRAPTLGAKPEKAPSENEMAPSKPDNGDNFVISYVLNTFHVLTDLLESDDNIKASVTVTQPHENPTAPFSDEDSGEEDGGLINNLPGSLLHAPANLVLDDSFDTD
ncbi:piggyBac transposable element-derived protein 3 [Trichonephila clavipes]|nr:piggyBac transposable element-derived protein 3 [Trichonephila clavipes]